MDPTTRGDCSLLLMPIKKVRVAEHVLLDDINICSPARRMLNSIQNIPATTWRDHVRLGVKQKSLRSIDIANDFYVSEACFIN
jgi:hypothetical protein